MKRALAFLALFASTAFLFGQDKPEPNKAEPKNTSAGESRA